MSRYLIILTNVFPYSKNEHEPFLETELPAHVNNFDRVIVIAREADKNAHVTKFIPDGVDTYNINTKANWLDKLPDVIQGVLKAPFPSKVYKLDSDAVGKSLLKKAFLEYFETRSQRQFKACKSILNGYNFSADSEIVIYSYWYFMTARIGDLIKQELKKLCPHVKFVSRAHRYDVYETFNSLNYLPMRRHLLNEMDKLYACSFDAYNHITKQLPECADKVEVSFLGTLNYGMGPDIEDCFHLVSCSRVSPVKRVERIANSLSLLEGWDLPFRWTHIGSGEDLEEIEEFAQDELGFMETDFPGFVSNRDVYDFYEQNHVSVFINVSSSEGLPVSIMEAMSFGIPVIATDVGGTSEIVKKGYNGYLLPENFKDEELAALLVKFTRLTKQDYLQLRKNARETWENRFSAERNYSHFSFELLNFE